MSFNFDGHVMFAEFPQTLTPPLTTPIIPPRVTPTNYGTISTLKLCPSLIIFLTLI